MWLEFRFCMVGKGGLEPPRLAARGPKPRLSASSSTSPDTKSLKMVTKSNRISKDMSIKSLQMANLFQSTGMDVSAPPKGLTIIKVDSKRLNIESLP